jgi:hypothetical protein
VVTSTHLTWPKTIIRTFILSAMRASSFVGIKMLCSGAMRCNVSFRGYTVSSFVNATEVSLRNIIVLTQVGTTVVSTGSLLTLTSDVLQYFKRLTSQ